MDDLGFFVEAEVDVDQAACEAARSEGMKREFVDIMLELEVKAWLEKDAEAEAAIFGVAVDVDVDVWL